ncbi:transcription factor 7-like 1-A [Poecilia latipinna]|uniref:transcription factor 7-like 1-A n=1 Tax=Poecilia latipinna TaxID=48699 RepID=UPI00072EB177|nr:PREDICTED: transcription factor 7-like 1-A [Poecilia latipinna]
MSEHIRSWASTQELIEEFDHILTENRWMLDNLANVDGDLVEEFLKEELFPSTPLFSKPSLSPVIPAPPQMGQSNEGPGTWTSAVNKEDSESSVSDSTHKGESDGILATKKEVLVTLDWDSVDDLLRETSGKDEDSESSDSIKKFLEEFNVTLQEEFENKVWTYGDNMEDLPRKEVLLPPPPSLLLHLHPPALPPNVNSVASFSVDATVPVRYNNDQDNVFRPPPLTFLPPAPSAPPPPSSQEMMEDVDHILAENVGNMVPADWNVKEEFLPGNVLLLLPPPPSPLILLGPPQFYTDTLILHSLPIVHVPEGFKLEPIGVLNGETLYGVVPPPPLNVGRRKSSFSTPSRVRDQRDDGQPYVKKPPNAFMLFLKEIRPKVVSELNINRSVMVNRFVGEMWNSLAVEVKARYYEKARLEQRLHQQQHPGWSTNDNYGKKRKRVKSKTSEQQQQQQYGLPSTKPGPFLCLIPHSTSETAQDHQGPKAETESGGPSSI